MCEFCVEHGEGKKWYLQMKNYSEVLLHEELSSYQKEVSGVTTRVEWLQRYFEDYVLPAITGLIPQEEDTGTEAPSLDEQVTVRLSEDELVARQKIDHFGQVLPIEDVETVIDMVDSITRMPCGCRFFTTGKTDKRYCFGFAVDKWGVLGKFPESASSLEVLSKEEAKKIMREYDREGLMHSIWPSVTPYATWICNCDRDCVPYKRYIEEKGVPSFFRAEYICQVDWDLCNGCKTCISQCQFGAEFYSSVLEKVYIDPIRCFGCGVCRAVCPNGAITLVSRQDNPKVAELWLKSNTFISM